MRLARKSRRSALSATYHLDRLVAHHGDVHRHGVGCFADPDDLLAWDVITSASELARSVGGRHIDTILNAGCVNPTKVSGIRLSIYSINLETAKDTFGPTIKSRNPVVTVANDAVFARLVESLCRSGRRPIARSRLASMRPSSRSLV